MRKGQAAIEFLVTYGWAIMAAMVVIGALAYFGMTNPSTILPGKCIFDATFNCDDYIFNTTGVKMKLTNSFGQTIYGDPTLGIFANLSDTSTGVCTISDSPKTFLDPDDEIEVICDNIPDAPFNTKEKAKAKITVTYYKSPSGGYPQIASGEVYATVQ